jgi:hypothetical protein
VPQATAMANTPAGAGSSERPPNALPVWCMLRDVTLNKCRVDVVSGKGLGLVANERIDDGAPLLTVPHASVLNSEAVQLYTKTSMSFKTLYDAVGRHSTRRDVLLFLLIQLLMPEPIKNQRRRDFVAEPWEQYLTFLPIEPPIPTLWSEGERELLAGTSLEVGSPLSMI